MPETPHHAFQIHISLESDFLGSMTEELISYFKTNTLWYALKHETGESGKLHCHSVCIFEIQTAASTGGAKTIGNLKRSIRTACPKLRQFLEDHPSRYAVVVQSLKSDELICEYLQKESELKYYKLPSDMCELKPYFADMQKEKPLNPEFDKWEKMYMEEKREIPCTFDSSWDFFSDHMDVKNDMKKVCDPRKFNERVNVFVCHINKERRQKPLKRPNSGPVEGLRICPRCTEKDVTHPQILEPREQYCRNCKLY